MFCRRWSLPSATISPDGGLSVTGKPVVCVDQFFRPIECDACPCRGLEDDLGLRTRRTSARGKRAGGAYRDDDVVDRLAGGGSVGFVGEERGVGGRRVPVETVGRQGG